MFLVQLHPDLGAATRQPQGANQQTARLDGDDVVGVHRDERIGSGVVAHRQGVHEPLDPLLCVGTLLRGRCGRLACESVQPLLDVGDAAADSPRRQRVAGGPVPSRRMAFAVLGCTPMQLANASSDMTVKESLTSSVRAVVVGMRSSLGQVG